MMNDVMVENAFNGAPEANRDAGILTAEVAQLAQLPKAEYLVKQGKPTAARYDIPVGALDGLIRDEQKAVKERAEVARAERAHAEAEKS